MEKPTAPAAELGFWTLLPLRLYFAIAGRLLPKRAAERFLHLFATPPRIGLKPPHEQLLARAQPFEFYSQSVAEPGQKLRIQGYAWGKDGADKVILLIHGWRGKAADYYKLIPVLEEAGYVLHAIDLPAHGASEGRYCSVIDTEVTLRAYWEAFGMPHAMVAHSLGAAASALALAGPGRLYPAQTPSRLILLTHPVVLEYAFWQSFALFGVPKPTQEVIYRLAQERFGVTMDEINLLKLARPLPEYTLSVYVPHDEEAPQEYQEDFLRAFPAVQSLWVPDGDHSRIMRHPAAIHGILQFLQEPKTN